MGITGYSLLILGYRRIGDRGWAVDWWIKGIGVRSMVEDVCWIEEVGGLMVEDDW